jgi:antitoxin (DNA-binding transcriptional repressor) of toxin-antitoxin stability system
LAERVTVTDVARNFAEYLNRVAYRRESLALVRGNKPVAELRPVPAGRRLKDLPSMMAALPRLSESEATAFSDDLETARADIGSIDMDDRWLP